MQDRLYAHKTITGVACSGDGRHVAANYLNDEVYLFSLKGLSEGPVPLPNPAMAGNGNPVSNGRRRARADVSAAAGAEQGNADEDGGSPCYSE